MLSQLVSGEAVVDFYKDKNDDRRARILVRCEAMLQLISPLPSVHTEEGTQVSFFVTVGENHDAVHRQRCVALLPDNEVAQFVELVAHHTPLSVFLHVSDNMKVRIVGFHFGNRNYEV